MNDAFCVLISLLLLFYMGSQIGSCAFFVIASDSSIFTLLKLKWKPKAYLVMLMRTSFAEKFQTAYCWQHTV